MKKYQIYSVIILIALIVISFLFLNNKINNIDLIKEERIVMTNDFSKNLGDIKPAIVRILAETTKSELPFTGGEYVLLDNKVYSSGTGFIVTDDGYLLTANHVVKDAKNVVVYRIINNEFKGQEAKVISSNKDADIALLKIEGKNLPTVKLGDYNQFGEGMDIGFTGFPLTVRLPLTHKGLISGKGLFNYDSSSNPVQIFVINAFVNQGNSGGPLFSADTGEVIGIINARMNVVDERNFLKLPDNYSPIMTLGGLDPIRLSVETYNSNLRQIGEVTQVGIGYSTSIEYGKELLKAAR